MSLTRRASLRVKEKTTSEKDQTRRQVPKRTYTVVDEDSHEEASGDEPSRRHEAAAKLSSKRRRKLINYNEQQQHDTQSSNGASEVAASAGSLATSDDGDSDNDDWRDNKHYDDDDGVERRTSDRKRTAVVSYDADSKQQERPKRAAAQPSARMSRQQVLDSVTNTKATKSESASESESSESESESESSDNDNDSDYKYDKLSTARRRAASVASKVTTQNKCNRHSSKCLACKEKEGADGLRFARCSTCSSACHLECTELQLAIVPITWFCPACARNRPKTHIKKILTWRWKKEEKKSMKEKEKDEHGSSDDDEIVEIKTATSKKKGEREYFVKYDGLSYWHCEWLSELTIRASQQQLVSIYKAKHDMSEPPSVDSLQDWCSQDYNMNESNTKGRFDSF